MPKELFGQNPAVETLDDNDRIALGQPDVAGAKNILWGKFKELLTSILDSIKLNPTYEPVSTTEAEIWWNGKYHTIEYDTGLGATIKVGQTVYDVFYNDTGATIPALKALHLKSAVLFNSELYPTFEYADSADYEKIQGTITISCCETLNGALGICARGATKLKGGDTSSFAAGSQLWVSDDGTGDLTATKPEFPSASISIGGNYNQEAAPDGEIFVNITSTFGDIFHEAWDGSVIESFDFLVTSDGVNVIGTLSNVNPLLNLTLNFSDGTFRLDTATTPLTIALTPGTDALEVTNYVYVPKSTKVLTLSTSGWPTTEHVRIAQLELQSALTTQADAGALGNQNINDHIKKEDNNGHILHIAAWIRKQFSTWDSGTEATFDNTGGNGYIQITGGVANQLHEQSLSSFSMVGGDEIRVWNDSSGNRPKISNLASITAYSDGSTWNNEWGKIVVWRGVNKSGEYSPVMFNLPSDGYNSEATALADLSNYADYTIPNNFKTKAILIATFTFRISGGVITYNTGYQDLRGTIPVVVAGGGSGTGGVTTYLALSDTPNTRVGQAGKVIICNPGETADEYEEKGRFWNTLRTFYHDLVSNADANYTATLPNKTGTFAFLDDIQSVEKNPFTETIEIANLLQYSPNYSQTGILNIIKGAASTFTNGVYEVGINCNGSAINFSSDFEIARNDYSDLGNPTGKFRFIFALMSDGLIGVSVYQSAEITFPTIQSATVENADPDTLVVVFSEAVNITDLTGLSLNFTTGTAKTLSSVLGTGTNTLTFALSGNVESADIFTLEVTSSNNITSVSSSNNVQATSESVINNVGAVSAKVLYDASQESNFIKDGAELITTWTDTSTEGLYPLTAFNSNGPYYDVANSRVDFQALYSSLINNSLASLFSEAVDFTLVIKVNLLDTGNQPIFYSALASTDRVSLGVFSGKLIAGYYDGTFVQKSADSPTGDVIITMINNAGVVTLRIDGVDATETANTPNYRTFSTQELYVGGYSDPSDIFDGSIYIFKMTDSALSGSELTAFENV